MSHQDSRKAPATFCDVASCFSEEEWKLLHHWQKELYNNVMKEIHQALISLGPLIATSVFSLRPKGREDLCPMDHQDSEIRGSVNPSQRDVTAESQVLFKKTSKAKQYLKDTWDTDQWGNHDGPSTGYEILNSDNVVRMQQEVESTLMVHYCAGGGESNTGPSLGHADLVPIVPFSIKEEGAMYSIDHRDSERGESITSTTKFPFHNIEAEASLRDYRVTGGEERNLCLYLGPEVTTPAASIGINEEGETYAIDIQDYKRKEHITTPTGDGSLNKQRKVGDSTKWTRRAPPSQATPGKVNTKVLHSSHKGRHSRIQVFSESIQELGGAKTTPCQSGFRNTAHFNLHQRSIKGESSDTYSEYSSNLRNLKSLKCPPNAQQKERPYAFTECGERYSLKGKVIRHIRTQTGVRPYACTECKKSFFQRQQLIRHCRTHTGEKPYACTFCNKRFNRKDYLNVHKRIHTGERPYKCTECEKSFTWKNDLNQHRRKHAKCDLDN